MPRIRKALSSSRPGEALEGVEPLDGVGAPGIDSKGEQTGTKETVLLRNDAMTSMLRRESME